MSWLLRYRLKSYLQQSTWLFPILGIVAALMARGAISRIDASVGMEERLDPGATREILEALASSMFTLIVFVSSAMLLAVQLASSQMTPRVISFFFRDPVTKIALTMFVSCFTFAEAVALRIHDDVPMIAVRLAAYSCLAALVFFLYLIDHVGKFLRPSGILRVVALSGRSVIERTYPKPFDAEDKKNGKPAGRMEGLPAQIILNKNPGVILAMDVKGLVALARRHDCIIEQAPQVGELVSFNEPLFRVYGGAPKIPESELHGSIALGIERTMEQDPTFPLRVLVDIASKGLSPAINDPTTAVLAIDQIHRLLRMAGLRKLDEGHVYDEEGRLRFIHRTPDWEDFVMLAVTEIRHFGAGSIQVIRRLTAMLENLIETAPDARKAILKQELKKIQRSVRRAFEDVDDRAMAKISDSQGVGGAAEVE